MGTPESIGYGDGYLFSYPIRYRVGFGYRILSSNLRMSGIISDPNSIYCHPYLSSLVYKYLTEKFKVISWTRFRLVNKQIGNVRERNRVDLARLLLVIAHINRLSSDMLRI